MEETFEVRAELRSDAGKGASRRLRREKKVPAVLYGGDQEPVSLTLTHAELDQHLQHEAFYSHILTVKYDGKAQKAVLRDVQRHPSKPWVMHVDLQRVSEGEAIRMNVPLHFINEETARGVKQQGGVISHLMTEVEVSCLAKDLPEFIEVDVAGLKVGESVHLSELVLPPGVQLTELAYGAEHDLAVVNISMPRGAVEAAAEAEAVETGEGAGEE
ncbi:MAG: 50S ribosomal protein L25/general stress protein Ctc [Gammaproteobacteria bacterium]|nr:50S ribosomal protein L25/general stress protein Ctc [Gammaproteobacteria bacterium]NIR98643.1 50S ribosomal protein L25/general stress protein Ctc [Gammaproteobacteria bacterium]NIT64360.1 50S ribosomal protein L25/general stress protein Ctc [Gammaproteobacteria bacterium]NIV21292.1 50S ribosomal protein L25/general stress protein Ctc [Gammaproteobacteria bacterium]NIY32940.1 50S ribosomal protein L25/general stress protein Ctc [Gammaproteobacteria bacterium]